MKTSTPIGIPKSSDSASKNSSEQIEKRGQLATMKASFSLEAVSDATCQHGESPAWDLSPKWARQKGTGSKLDWSKRYGTLRREDRWKNGQSSESAGGIIATFAAPRHYSDNSDGTNAGIRPASEGCGPGLRLRNRREAVATLSDGHLRRGSPRRKLRPRRRSSATRRVRRIAASQRPARCPRAPPTRRICICRRCR
ncbi:hypothetical protein OKW43_004858 [Paraburkholderia sp. WC7.3g]